MCYILVWLWPKGIGSVYVMPEGISRTKVYPKVQDGEEIMEN
jgi:hypothetical protein